MNCTGKNNPWLNYIEQLELSSIDILLKSLTCSMRNTSNETSLHPISSSKFKYTADQAAPLLSNPESPTQSENPLSLEGGFPAQVALFETTPSAFPV